MKLIYKQSCSKTKPKFNIVWCHKERKWFRLGTTLIGMCVVDFIGSPSYTNQPSSETFQSSSSWISYIIMPIDKQQSTDQRHQCNNTQRAAWLPSKPESRLIQRPHVRQNMAVKEGNLRQKIVICVVNIITQTINKHTCTVLHVYLPCVHLLAP